MREKYMGKPKHRRVLATILAVLAAVTGVAQAVLAQTGVDIDTFVAEDSFNNIKISPNGEYFAVSIPREGQIGLAVIRRADMKVMSNFRFATGTSVADFWWVNNERVIMSVAETFGTRDQPVATGELYAMNMDGSRQEFLVGFRLQTDKTSTHIRTKTEEDAAAYLLNTLPADDKNVLITVMPFSRDPYSRVDKLNVYTGKRNRVTTVPVTRASFVTDSRAQVRFAEGSMSDNYSQLYYRESDQAEWKRINHEKESGRRETPLGFSDDDSVAYLQVTHDDGPDSIVAMDVATGARREVARDARVDPWVIYRANSGSVPVGVRYLGDKPRLVFFDETSADAKLYRMLEQAFGNANLHISSSTADGRTKLIHTDSDVDPGSIYLFDTETKKADFVMARGKAIDPDKMSPMREVSFNARDGLPLQGYLTVPLGSDGKSLPLVLMPHGGPFGVFDTWGFDTDAQLLAQAGYAVLQINYRGSGNYGRAFREKGAQQWGGTMQDDLTDATRWVIEQGIADPARICIYGASYGGYAALMGVAKEPDLFRCAVGYVGVYDLPRMQREDVAEGSKWLSTWSRDWVGNDQTALAAVSPNRIAERIKAPVFLAAGGEDKVAPIKHSELMEAALKRGGVPVETLYFPREGHGFYTVEHKREFYVRLLDFLDRHIGNKRR
jgi:dipeptidyl aminopeptidase/acylaminoacyl peptidase